MLLPVGIRNNAPTNQPQPTKNVDTTKTITHVSLCSGYGGIDLGLRRAVPDLRTIAYCEREAFPISILLRRIEEGQLDAGPIHTDLKAFPWELFRDRVGILSGGYPCQPFSAAGNRQGKNDPRHLWPWIAEGITIMRPKQCFFENVDGHISMGLSSVISDLEELGYAATWGVFSASEVGAPHQRKRVFILADRIDEGSQGRLLGWTNPQRQSINGYSGRGGTSILGRWPAGPGEFQHDWEPPRVVADTKQLRRGGGHHGDASGDCGQVQAEGSRSREVADPESGFAGLPQGGFGRQGLGGGGPEARQLGNPERRGCESRNGHGSEPEILGPRRESGFGLQPEGQTQPAFCGDSHGASDRVGYAELCRTYDNRTHELRALGNGVVPAQCTHAYRTLVGQLINPAPQVV